MDGPLEYYAERNNSENAKNHVILLMCSTQLNLIDMDSSMVVTRGKGVEDSTG